VAAFLRSKRLLLVLDNLEQVIASGPAIADHLLTDPNICVLATSRVLLRISDERVFPVSPLPLPPPNPAPQGSLAKMAQTASIALFVQRAPPIPASS
jgi:predicted ATPase